MLQSSTYCCCSWESVQTLTARWATDLDSCVLLFNSKWSRFESHARSSLSCIGKIYHLTSQKKWFSSKPWWRIQSQTRAVLNSRCTVFSSSENSPILSQTWKYCFGFTSHWWCRTALGSAYQAYQEPSSLHDGAAETGQSDHHFNQIRCAQFHAGWQYHIRIRCHEVAQEACPLIKVPCVCSLMWMTLPYVCGRWKSAINHHFGFLLPRGFLEVRRFLVEVRSMINDSASFVIFLY